MIKAKLVVCCIAVWFALLQTLSPFIHAHIDAEHPIQTTGFHVGDAHENPHDLTHLDLNHADFNHVDFAHHVGHHASDQNLSAATHPPHAISIASGIKHDIDPFAQIQLNAFIIICLCFALFAVFVAARFIPPVLNNYHHSKRWLPAPRAPPAL